MQTNSTQLTIVQRGTPGSVSLLAIANQHAGIRIGSRAIACLMSWAMAEGALGRPLGDGQGVTAAVEEYSSWWRQSRRTTFRDLDAFRRAFPSEDTPARLAAEARALRVARQGFKGYANLPVMA